MLGQILRVVKKPGSDWTGGTGGWPKDQPAPRPWSPCQGLTRALANFHGLIRSSYTSLCEAIMQIQSHPDELFGLVEVVGVVGHMSGDGGHHN